MLQTNSPIQRWMKVENFNLEMLRCRARAFSYSTTTISRPSTKNAHAYEKTWLAAILFSFRRDFLCEFELLTIGNNYASKKGMPAV